MAAASGSCSRSAVKARRNRVAAWIVAGAAIWATFLCGAVAAQSAEHDPRPGYVGDAACVHCHVKESDSYAHTAHRAASALPSERSVLGRFGSGGNVLTISDEAKNPEFPSLFFMMEKSGSGFFETAVTGWGKEMHKRRESIDVVTGSGTRGQTYLYWQGDKLFELPVSYWSDGKRWVNSPGYADGTADFARPVNPGCLECHASYIAAASNDTMTNTYVRGSLVTGIGCESCHGGGAAHVAKYAGGAAHASDSATLNPAKFTRDLQVDACAVCHSGIQRRALLPAYSFVPGRPLKDYFEAMPGEAAEHPDVHGNQVGLLQRSKCYQNSATLSCSTCHNVHEPERAAATYSEKCMTCHQWQSCGESKTMGAAIKTKCIACHMPVEETKVIASETAGQTVRARMRNHWIKVYPMAKTSASAGL